MSTRYEVRLPGDGEFDYFLQDPECEENGFDPKSKKSAIAAAKNESGAKVVKVVETEISL